MQIAPFLCFWSSMRLLRLISEPYLIIVIFFTLTQFLENKIYTQKTRKLRQNTQKIAHFLRYYGKIHSKLPIFRVKSVKIYTCQKKFTRAPPVTIMRYGRLVLVPIIWTLSIPCCRYCGRKMAAAVGSVLIWNGMELSTLSSSLKVKALK